MANPRELAEQAFSLLQNALRDSEARASELDEQLKRKRAPKTKLEEQLDVLAHRLEAVEQERTHWQQQATQLEEIAEAERTKVSQLRKKLEVAESGPDKLGKKEVNFWRAKGEEFTAQLQEYRDRLATLRREVIERDALIEKLRDTQQTGGVAAVPTGAEPAPRATAEPSQLERDEIDKLRAQVTDRDRHIGELQADLAAAQRTQSGPTPEHSLEIQARIETLSRQVATFDQALNDAHAGRAALKSDLAAARADLEQVQRAAREAQADADRAHEVVEEREHRIVELSAEIESTRQRAAAERGALSAVHGERDELRSAATQSNERAEQFRAELEQLRRQLAEQSNGTRDAIATSEAAQATLAEREQQLGAMRGQVAASDRELNDRARRISELEHAIAEQRDALERNDQERVERERELAGHGEQLTERNRALSSLTEALEQARATLDARDREVASMRDTLLAANRDLDHWRSNKYHLDGALADALARADEAETSLAQAIEENRELAEYRDQIIEQVAGLDRELKEEKENAENLGEIANERREHITKLQEKVEEAEERYEEAKYRLGKAARFERLVKRRKGLIGKLLEALRQRQKANTALKAGIDGLRTYKASAEMNQQKLLQRIDGLKTELQQAEETIARHHSTTSTRELLASSQTKVTSLEARLDAQAQVIETLESDLKAARTLAKSGSDKKHEIEHLHDEIERLQRELETKSKAIVELEADADDQQRKLAKLRGSESETIRLKALTEKDRTSIDALERECAQLREALARQSSENGAGGSSAELESKLRGLTGTIKEHEATIKKLTDSAESWKRKYQFLATDSPDAYKTVVEK